eukprot:15435416-Alexandrium_andersonii.AAC.1
MPVPPPAPPGTPTGWFRRALAHDVDLPCAHCVTVPVGPKNVLRREFDLDTLRTLYERRVHSMSARAALMQGSASTDCAWRRGERLHAFWADPHQDFHSPGQEFADVPPIQLPDTAVFGLRSAADVAHLSVVLWAFQPIANAPRGVRVCPASRLMSPQLAEAMLGSEFHIAHLADVVRLLAMQADDAPSWFADVDAFWIRDPSA